MESVEIFARNADIVVYTTSQPIMLSKRPQVAEFEAIRAKLYPALLAVRP